MKLYYLFFWLFSIRYSECFLLYKIGKSLNRVINEYNADNMLIDPMVEMVYPSNADDIPSTNNGVPMDTIPKMPSQKKLTEQEQYDLQWYVIGTPNDFSSRRATRATVWANNYAIWRNASTGEYYGIDDVCPHKGASLSGGKLSKGCLVCPYHGYEYGGDGKLKKVPGIQFQQHHDSEPLTLPAYDSSKYTVVEKNGWVYLNTFPTYLHTQPLATNIFEEPEAALGHSCVFLEMDFDCYARVLSENSLDVMHIGFVHTFGNRENPEPTQEYPPVQVSPYHFKTAYAYMSGKDSMVKKIFNIRNLKIENEFILPHTTIARVIFGDYVSTVITFALPVSNTKSKLFVKTYRNFWKNSVGDAMTENMMRTTMLQDKMVVENIDMRFMDGKFNMKYDKLQNTYKTFYKRFVRQNPEV